MANSHDQTNEAQQEPLRDEEPVAYMNQNGVIHAADYEWMGSGNVLTPLYTRPQAREPLTDEQIKDVAASCMWWVREKDILDDAIEFARAIEAAHQIGVKNG